MEYAIHIVLMHLHIVFVSIFRVIYCHARIVGSVYTNRFIQTGEIVIQRCHAKIVFGSSRKLVYSSFGKKVS